jgi:poly(3-hydroxybutyrate) depolymerase
MRIGLALVLSLCLLPMVAQARSLDASFVLAGHNRPQLERALADVPPDQRRGMTWLLQHMPEGDLRTLDAAFLLENVDLAYGAWRRAPWHDDVPESVFLDSILPYASINERREAWRRPLGELCRPLVDLAHTTAQAATMLNKTVFPEVGVKYSTQRPKPDQSPQESIDAGMASCTGLSVLLIDACRSVGVPARFVGTPLWSDGSGNHSWVEIWHDGDWHFTGAAEPTGDNLDKAWFAARAAGAVEGDPNNAIFAVTWRDVPLHFPLVWLPEDRSVGAVDVSSRYAPEVPTIPQGHVRLRIRVRDADGFRQATEVKVLDIDDVELARGLSRDERCDANDHLEVTVPNGAQVQVQARGVHRTVMVDGDEQLVDLRLPSHVNPERPCSKAEAAAIKGRLCEAWADHERALRRAHMESGVLEFDGYRMPFEYTVHGDVPQGGRSLYISMHGGGGAPKEVNDRQWRNQLTLYSMDEGVYVAPRAPTDTWNLWHQAHIDPLFDMLIQNMVLLEQVNPNRVYLTGFSAGGDGVFQLAPRMADRFAAAAMMAGHPNETKPDGLRNLPFSLHVGGKDKAYERNAHARRWKTLLDDLQKADPQGYAHDVQIHETKGHWMDRKDAAGVRWMAQHTRELRPTRIVWLQDDVLQDRFYWLKVDQPVARDRVVVERAGQVITIAQAGAPKRLHIRLDDAMVDLDRPVVVQTIDGTVLFEGVVARREAVIARTLEERGDPEAVFTAEIILSLPSI